MEPNNNNITQTQTLVEPEPEPLFTAANIRILSTILGLILVSLAVYRFLDW